MAGAAGRTEGDQPLRWGDASFYSGIRTDA